MSIGILGGGLTGAALKHFLPDAELIEQEPVLGGLCRSFCKDGFQYDLGGHILFSKDQQTLAFITKTLGKNVERHYRRNFVFYRGRFVLYPFENGLPDLPVGDRLDCLIRYLVRPRSKPRNFGEWIVTRFGKAIAERYLTPYNEKIWKTPLEDISTGWVERVPDPPFWDIFKGAVGVRTEGYRHQLHFFYPRDGGIQSLVTALAGHGQDIRRNFVIHTVKKTSEGWVVSSGEEEHRYDRLISTIPTPDLVDMLSGVPAHVREAAAGLRYNSLLIVMVGAVADRPPEQLAVYFPQQDVLFHRLVFPSYLGANYAPSGTTSMVAEITLPPGDPTLALSDAEIAERVIAGLVRTKFLCPSNVVATDVRRVRYAYVVDTHDRKRRMETIRTYLDSQGITLCGRFAEFEYLNMDACVIRARITAGRLA